MSRRASAPGVPWRSPGRPPLAVRLACAILLAPLAASASIPACLADLHVEFQDAYASLHDAGFQALCAAHDLDPDDPTNRETYFRIRFAHDLLTTVGASDGARGGFLRIPYFWHWVDPNPRHAIISLPDSTRLSAQPAPPPCARYASRADIDRVPALFLGDLVTDRPGYAHPDCGSFHTFGWCSEREMAYTALLSAWGYDAKIRQSGIHTHTSVWAEFRRRDGGRTPLVADVDNTFDGIAWRDGPPRPSLDDWYGDVGAGTQIGWYNRMAHDPDQIAILRRTPVGATAQNRLRGLVADALRVRARP